MEERGQSNSTGQHKLILQNRKSGSFTGVTDVVNFDANEIIHEGKSDNEEEPDNPHFHVLVPIRPFTEEGIWGNKQRREYILDEDGNRVKDAKGKEMFNAVSTTGWNDPELLKEWRRAWTEKVNGKFRECHMAARIDHRSYKEQGIDLIPTIHEGYEVRAMEKKGIKTVIGELNRAIRQFKIGRASCRERV